MSSHQDDCQPQGTLPGGEMDGAHPAAECALSAADARLLDFLAEHGFDAAKISLLPEADRPRALAMVRQLDLLELYPVEPVHESIVDATLARIDHFEADRAEAMRVGSGRRRRLRLADLVSVAALLLVALGVTLPILAQMRAQSLSTVCSNNLRALGGGLAAYANEHGGSMPAMAGIGGMFNAPEASAPPNTFRSAGARAPRGMGAPQSGAPSQPNQWSIPVLVKRSADGRSLTLTPDWGTYNHSANLALLVAKGYCSVHAMRCPGCASGAACFAYKVPAQGARFQLDTPYRMVVVADANPVIELRRNGEKIDRSVLSSRNHGEAGQNLLFGDISVDWRTSPILVDSPSRLMDNIWLPRGEDGREHLDLKVRPKDPNDTFVAQ